MSVGSISWFSPIGGRYWKFKYRHGGKERLLALGVYPDVSLKAAREKRGEARRLVAAGVDPNAQRAAQRLASADSFEAIAREWFAKEEPSWSPSHAGRILRRLQRDVFPYLGSHPISDIKPPAVLALARRIVDRGAVETAHRTLQNVRQVMRFAVATGRAERDATAALQGALPSSGSNHLAAVTDPVKLGELLRAIDGYQGTLVVNVALRFAPHVFVRPRELRRAEWREVDLGAPDGPLWSIPGEKMKGGRPHMVPLSWQAETITGVATSHLGTRTPANPTHADQPRRRRSTGSLTGVQRDPRPLSVPWGYPELIGDLLGHKCSRSTTPI